MAQKCESNIETQMQEKKIESYWDCKFDPLAVLTPVYLLGDIVDLT
jgi:hypothetical protein